MIKLAGAPIHSRPRRRLLHVLMASGLYAAGTRLGRAHATTKNSDVQVWRPKLSAVPSIALTTMQGRQGLLDSELANSVPLVLNFVFTTCSASCSIQTAVLAEVQRQERARGRKLQLASITIDPDNDTPDQLRRFAHKFDVGEGWQFYTGRFDDLLRVQRHFDVYRGSKASHPPVLLMRREALSPWVRVEGFPGASEILKLLESLPGGA